MIEVNECPAIFPWVRWRRGGGISGLHRVSKQGSGTTDHNISNFSWTSNYLFSWYYYVNIMCIYLMFSWIFVRLWNDLTMVAFSVSVWKQWAYNKSRTVCGGVVPLSPELRPLALWYRRRHTKHSAVLVQRHWQTVCRPHHFPLLPSSGRVRLQVIVF